MSEEKILEEKETKKANKGRRGLVWGIIVVVIVVLIAALVVEGVVLYKSKGKNSFALNVAKVLPYPAAMVDFNIIKYSDWRADVDTLNYYMTKQEELGLSALDIPEGTTVEETVLTKLIKSELLKRLAAQYQVSVSEDEVNSELEIIYASASGGKTEVESTLKELYNWTVDQFADEVINEYILREKVKTALAEDANFNKSALEEIDGIAEKIKNGEITFEEAAQQYSDDYTSATSGGELGDFVKGDMVTEFEDAVLKLSEGEISAPVRTEYGYHLIKLVSKSVNADTQEETFNAKHILVSVKSIDEVLEEMMTNSRIYHFAK